MICYEVVVLLNVCFDCVIEVIDELCCLMVEFEIELVIFKGCVDGFEVCVGELEVIQFFIIIKFKGYIVWVFGVVDGIDGKEVIIFNYDFCLKLVIFFIGKDQLIIVLWFGNFDNFIFGIGLIFVEIVMSSGNSVKVGCLFYIFFVGDFLSVIVGFIVCIDDVFMYVGYVMYYFFDLLFDFFIYGGVFIINNLGFIGFGVGVVYIFGDSGFKVSGNYVVKNGVDFSKGIGINEIVFIFFWQFFYEGEVFDGNLFVQVGYFFD